MNPEFAYYLFLSFVGYYDRGRRESERVHERKREKRRKWERRARRKRLHYKRTVIVPPPGTLAHYDPHYHHHHHELFYYKKNFEILREKCAGQRNKNLTRCVTGLSLPPPPKTFVTDTETY